MKKIALCISGQFRYHKKAINNLKKYLIDPYQCDIFVVISTNIEKNSIKTCNISNIEIKLKEIFKNNLKKYSILDESKVVDKVQNNYNYQNVDQQNKIQLEKYIKNIDNLIRPSTMKRYQCNLLQQEYEKTHNFLYDIVLVTRLDIYLESKFIFNLNPQPNVVYNYKTWECFFYADSKTINKACEIHPTISHKLVKTFGYEKFNLNYKILRHLLKYRWNWKNFNNCILSTGSPDVVLIYHWLITKKLKISQINDLNPNFKGAIIRDNGKEIFYAPTKPLTIDNLPI